MKQQCLGTTKNGERCKITGNLVDGYCYRHRPVEKSPAPQPRVESPAEPPHSPPPPAEVGTL